MASSASKGKASANDNAADIPYELPWYCHCRVCLHYILKLFHRVEKYRPKVLDDVVGNEDTIERLKVIAKDGNCPHIIISVRRPFDVHAVHLNRQIA